MDFSKKYKLGTEKPLSVSQYTEFVNEILKRVKARVIGEVSSLQIAASGHVYFSLRDKQNNSVLNCVVWSSIYKMCGVVLKEGMEIIITGYSDIYGPRGTINFKTETIELVGEGALKKAYDELKNKLDQEGLFDIDKKRSIPEYPREIGVITSLRSGTVIHDFMSNLGKFGFKVKAMDSRVEGQEAIKDLISCVKQFKKEKIDVLVIIRGGGSLQSLMAFDNESLVREIVNFPVPVISGIGHHKDVTLVALASDSCQSTPTAAANILNKPWENIYNNLDKFQKIIINDYEYLLSNKKNELKSLTLNIIDSFKVIFESYKNIETSFIKSLFKINYSINSINRKIKEFFNLINMNFNFTLNNNKKLINEFEKIIKINNPENQLKLGYAIVKSENKVIKSINEIKEKDLLTINIYDGIIKSYIKKIIKKND